jgi:hypothetical protein
VTMLALIDGVLANGTREAASRSRLAEARNAIPPESMEERKLLPRDNCHAATVEWDPSKRAHDCGRSPQEALKKLDLLRADETVAGVSTFSPCAIARSKRSSAFVTPETSLRPAPRRKVAPRQRRRLDDREPSPHRRPVRVAPVPVGLGAQPDAPPAAAGERDARPPVDARPEEMEVVNARAVADDEGVPAVLHAPNDGPVRPLKRNREAGPTLP